jgi:HTH-type transcriptional regulator/antitoxin HigA
MRRELEARGWSQRDLAEIMKRPPQAIAEIVTGVKQITPETASELGAAFGTSAELWMNLESRYRLTLSRRKPAAEAKAQAIRAKGRLYELVPVRELIRRGWIRKAVSIEALERQVQVFLGVAKLGEDAMLATSFRHSAARRPEPGAQLAWVKRVESLARREAASRYDESILRAALPGLVAKSPHPQSCRQVLEELRGLGVRIVLLERLPRTYLDGAAFWLDEERPVIGLTLRFDRIDYFWFTLVHELIHILEKHAARVEQTEDGAPAPADAEEEEANIQAQELLVPSAALTGLRKGVGITAVEPLARALSRHPGIIVGQLQHRGLMEYRQGRTHLVKVRHHLAGLIQD